MNDLPDQTETANQLPANSPSAGQAVSSESGPRDRSEPESSISGRRLSNRDFELVIRRAAELQAKEGEGSSDEGMEQADALRIGREIGLSTQHLHRALLEVTGNPNPESGLLVSLFGPALIQAGRTLPGSPAEVAKVLEQYLVEREYLAVQRRFPDRTHFVRATGMVAAMGRGWSQVVTRSPLLRVASLDVSVRRIEEGYVYVTLSTRLNSTRTAAALTSMIAGAAATATVGVPLFVLVAPIAALAALPILAGSVYGGHAYYANTVERDQIQLESLLDRLEHGELAMSSRSRTVPWGLIKP